jgi:hypothetical protein
MSYLFSFPRPVATGVLPLFGGETCAPRIYVYCFKIVTRVEDNRTKHRPSGLLSAIVLRPDVIGEVCRPCRAVRPGRRAGVVALQGS